MGLFTTFVDYAPFLESDFPLFSWDDFPQSRDALVKGTPTERFETACWNYMVAIMEYMILQMDRTWSVAPYFWIGESKQFTSDMYRQMIYTMSTAIPVYREEEHRFYLASGPGDYLTTDHLKFVARYLNKLIRLARGTDEIARLIVDQNVVSTSNIRAFAWPSVPVVVAGHGNTVPDIKIAVLPSVPLHTKVTSRSLSEITALVADAKRIVVDQKLRTNCALDLVKRISVPAAADAIGRSVARVSILTTKKSDLSADVLPKTLCEAMISTPAVALVTTNATGRGHFSAKIDQGTSNPIKASVSASSSNKAEWNVSDAVPLNFMPVGGKTISLADISCLGAESMGQIGQKSDSNPLAGVLVCNAETVEPNITGRGVPKADLKVREASNIHVEQVLRTNHFVRATTRTARPAWADGASVSSGVADVDLLPAVNVTVSESSTTDATCALDLLDAADIQSNTLAFSKTSCEAAIFLLPLQPDSKTLFIRQTYREAIKIGNTLYIDEWPDQGLTDDGTLFLWRIYDTTMQVGNTLYIGSMPDTGMTGSNTLLIWDVEQEPVQTLTLLEVF